MMIQKLYKRFAESVTRWKKNNIDEFLIARLKLTFYYFLTAIIILGISSVILYNTILSNLTQSILGNIFLSPQVASSIINRAQDILLNRFITIDAVIIFFVIILGFLLTEKTLQPIKLNMETQKRFIADASHELRTPTAVVISGLEVALNNKNLDFEGARKKLEDTLEEMREFSNLSNTLLDISKYNVHARREYEPLPIGALVKSIIEKSKNLAVSSSKEITFEIKMIDMPIVVNGNKVDLSRVFYNIFDNAIKYIPHVGVINVTDKVVFNKYIIDISDTGAGIPKSIIDRIFDPFFRGNVSRSTSGAGLGLTLTKKIIENHKGDIFIKSQEGKGTDVMISLPILT